MGAYTQMDYPLYMHLPAITHTSFFVSNISFVHAKLNTTKWEWFLIFWASLELKGIKIERNPFVNIFNNCSDSLSEHFRLTISKSIFLK